MRVPRRTLLLAVLATFVAAPGGVAGQAAAATLGTLDPAFADIARLEALGLVPRGWTTQRPFSEARVAWIARDARGWLAAADLARETRADAEALIRGLEARFGTAGGEGPSVFVEMEAGGGRSPGRSTVGVDNGLGEVDAVVNPLWAYRGGRAYGDRGTLAGAARVSVPLGTRLALGLAGRGSAARHGGAVPGRADGTVEAASLRAVVGRWAIQVGRDGWSWGWGGASGLLVSDNAPPVNLVRVATDRPLLLHVLGDTEVTFVVADLGASQDFAHAKLVGISVSARPSAAVELGLEILNKQGGEGAPEASFAERLKDISVVWDLFRRDSDYLFSDKMVAVRGRVVFPGGTRPEVYGQVAFTDFDHARMGDALTVDAAYLAGLRLPRLGASQRHSVSAEAQRTGALVYQHHTFTSGMTADGYLLGSALGPDGRSLTLAYGYDAPSRSVRGGVSATVEDRSVDPHEAFLTPVKDVRRTGSVPHETRWRVQATLARRLADGRSGVEVGAGLERVEGWAYVAGETRHHGAFSVRIWRSF